MISSKRISVPVLAFFGGIVTTLIVCGVAAYFVALFYVDGYHLRNAVQAQQRIYTLTYLKEGKLAKATEQLDMLLYGDLMLLERKTPTDRTDEAVEKAIVLARAYRDKYPRKSSIPEIDKTIDEILSEK